MSPKMNGSYISLLLLINKGDKKTGQESKRSLNPGLSFRDTYCVLSSQMLLCNKRKWENIREM